MWAYIVRRIFWTVPIVLGVLLITFTLFTLVAKDPARAYAGKHASPAALEAIRHDMGLDKAVWLNWTTDVKRIEASAGAMTIETKTAHGLGEGERMSVWGVKAADVDGTYVDVDGTYTVRSASPKTLTVSYSGKAEAFAGGHVAAASTGRRLSNAFNSQFFDLALFRFPKSKRYELPVGELFWRKAPVSLSIQLPVFVIELGLQLVLALFVASRRGRWPDLLVTFVAVLGMSVPVLSIYMIGQWVLGAQMQMFPVAGWGVGFMAMQFAALPILVSVVGGLGSGTRFYRTVVLEQINADYVRTARSKGVSQREVMLTHVLRNVMIPVLTNTVTALPGLLLGALILERLFQVPGAGGLLVEAIFNQDRPVVMAMTYVLSIVYCGLLLVTDILYTLVDPRVRLQ